MKKECYQDLDFTMRACMVVGGFIYTFWWVTLPNCTNALHVILAFILSAALGWLISTLIFVAKVIQFLIDWKV